MANIRGTDFDETLSGTESDDQIMGRGGNDEIFGYAGNDTLKGDDGDDILHGGVGDDTLFGGKGFDTFVFGLDSGADEIKDFDLAEDTIDLSAAGITSLDDMTITQVTGNSVMLSFNGNSILISGITSDDVPNINFVFAPTGPQFVQLGVNDSYTDAGNGLDNIIDGDNQGEELTDTDTFVFTTNFGNDTVTDFQLNTLLPDFTIVPGDILDLSAHGIYRTSLSDSTATTAFFASHGVTLTGADVDGDGQEDSVLTFSDGSSLTLLGIDTMEDMQIVVELQLTNSGV